MILNLGWFFVPFGAFVIVGAGNAVNLTDGLDGLAIVPVMIAAASFGLIAYLSGNAVFADYLQIHFVPGTGELAVLCGAVIGAGLGFLWFNAPPAAIFMGDTGSLALGGMLGAIAVATKHEIVLAIIGGLFVLEALSVIIQVASFKLTGKRVFRMAPIHHHFEQLGWTEPQIVIRFWIVAVVLALIGLSTPEDQVRRVDPGHQLQRQAASRSSASARSGRATARGARGRRRRWSRPGTTSGATREAAAAAGIPIVDLARRPTGASFDSAGARARRAAHPSRAALDGARAPRRRASRSSATSSSSAASGGGTCPTRRSSRSPAPTASRRRRR